MNMVGKCAVRMIVDVPRLSADCIFRACSVFSRFQRIRNQAAALIVFSGVVSPFSTFPGVLLTKRPRHVAELWNHESEQWQLLETPMAIGRTYHSSSVLVPDGRIYIGGGGLCFTCFPGQSGKICDCLNNHLDAEMYSPPYLFNQDGSPAVRPTVSIDQTSVGASHPSVLQST